MELEDAIALVFGLIIFFVISCAVGASLQSHSILGNMEKGNVWVEYNSQGEASWVSKK